MLAARIDRALRACDPAGRWQVAVEAGRAVVRGALDDEAERRAVTALVRTVPGTTTVDVTIATPGEPALTCAGTVRRAHGPTPKGRRSHTPEVRRH
ncbi:BON domain-containing protein [Actinosynnema pretiosum]|uniref:Uncharacterized protein n=1 Tax=Actinosynnema pretiosum TaxID=42197 RepID=A0A290Z3F1_9PSEU|nr:hypothetical protein CNX65_09545 [Actinosynnema pretiosum]